MVKATTENQYESTLHRILTWFLQTNEDFSGATATVAGEKGMVPQPVAGQQECFLRGDGTWANPMLAEIVVGSTQPTSNNAIWLETSA